MEGSTLEELASSSSYPPRGSNDREGMTREYHRTETLKSGEKSPLLRSLTVFSPAKTESLTCFYLIGGNDQPRSFAILDNGTELTEVAFHQVASREDKGEKQSELTIGRSRKNDAVFTDLLASRMHATVTWNGRNRQFQLEDLGSSNNTLYREATGQEIGVKISDWLRTQTSSETGL